MTDDAPRDDELRLVAALVKEADETQQEVGDLEAKLRTAQAKLRSLEYDQLPAALMALGYAAPTKMSIGGLAIELTEKFRCGQLEYPPSSRRYDNPNGPPRAKDPAKAFQWLDDNNHADIERNQVVVTLGNNSKELAEEITNLLRSHRAANSMDIVHKRVVLWNTLAALARELDKAGEIVPEETLGIHRERSVKIVKKG